MSNVIPFEFEQNRIRVIQTGDGDSLFVASDVARALGYAKPENAIGRHCKNAVTTPKQGGGFFSVIREPDVYRLIVKSRLPSAERFEAWVFEEVLPAIRKTGAYQVETPTPTTDDRLPVIARASALAGALDAAARAFGFDENMRLLSVNQAVQKRTGVNLLGELGATHLLSPINERYLTPTELGLPLDMSAIAVNRALRDLGYQRQQADGRGKNYWVLTETGRKAGGRMLDTGKRHGDGAPVQQLKWPESVGEALREAAA